MSDQSSTSAPLAASASASASASSVSLARSVSDDSSSLSITLPASLVPVASNPPEASANPKPRRQLTVVKRPNPGIMRIPLPSADSPPSGPAPEPAPAVPAVLHIAPAALQPVLTIAPSNPILPPAPQIPAVPYPEFVEIDVGERDSLGEFHVSIGYDQRFHFKLRGNDEFVRPVMQQGWLFHKHITVALWPFLELQQQLDALQPLPLGDNAQRPQQTVIEVGANVGVTAVPLAKCLMELGYSPADGRVFAFESQAPQLDLLKENAASNGLTNIIADVRFPGHETRQANFSKFNSSGEARGLEFSYTSPHLVNYGGLQLGSDGLEVSMEPLDSILKDLPARANVSVLKVEGEGAEKFTFYGARELIRRHHPIIIFDYKKRLSEEMIRTYQPNPAVLMFDILEYCSSLGYTKLVQLPRNHVMLIHPFRDIPTRHQEWLDLFIPMTHEQKRQKGFLNISPQVAQQLKFYQYSKPLWTSNGEVIKTGKTQRELQKAEQQLKRVRAEEEKVVREYAEYFQAQQLEQAIVQQSLDAIEQANQQLMESIITSAAPELADPLIDPLAMPMLPLDPFAAAPLLPEGVAIPLIDPDLEIHEQHKRKQRRR